jgi:SOS response regulatory protein OraA/RecX
VPQNAFEKAVRLLAQRARTASELERALEKAGIGGDERASTLERLRELGYLNDTQVARARASARIGRGDAPRLLVKKLEAQGIETSAARAAAEEAAAGASDDELAARALQRRLRGRKPGDMREKQRLVRWLAANGHRPSVAARALGIEWDGDDETNDL